MSRAHAGNSTMTSMTRVWSGYQSWQPASLTFARRLRPFQYLGVTVKNTRIMLRAHWKSCVTQSATQSGPLPWASASIAKTPRQPCELRISVVEKSSASSGPETADLLERLRAHRVVRTDAARRVAVVAAGLG